MPLILYTLVHHAPSTCCAIHPCHFILSALDPVCCCILTASLFSALFFDDDSHSIHTCHSTDTFPIPRAPHRIAVHIISCRFILVASVFMFSFQFTYATCPISATHFGNVCHSSHTFYLLHASYPFTHF